MDTYIKTFTSLPVDFLILAVLFGLVITIALNQGRSYLASAVLSLYVATFLFLELPFTKVLTSTIKGSANIFWIHLATFLIFYIPSYIILSKIVMTDFGYGAMRYVRASLLTVAFMGLLISIFYHIIPIVSVYNFSPAIDNLFTSDMMLNLWMLAPLAVLFS